MCTEFNLSSIFGLKVKSTVSNSRYLLKNSARILTQSVNGSYGKCHSILHLRAWDIIFLCHPYIRSSINYLSFTMILLYTRHHLICMPSVSSARLSSIQNSSPWSCSLFMLLATPYIHLHIYLCGSALEWGTDPTGEGVFSFYWIPF